MSAAFLVSGFRFQVSSLSLGFAAWLVQELLTACEFPPSQHGEPIDAGGAILLNRHCHAYCHPAAGFFTWDAYRLVGVDAGEATDVGDVCRRVVIVLRRCPPRDDASDGVETVLVVVRAGEQLEGCTPAVL